MKTIVAIVCTLFLASAVVAQCGPYKHHPLWPDTVGYASVHLNECGATSCLWDNGSTDTQTDLGVGPHWVVLFNGNTPDTLYFQIEQDLWVFDGQPFGIFIGVELSMWAHIVPYGVSQIFNNPACRPDPDSTTIYLLQDGIAMDSIHPVNNSVGEQRIWQQLPYGHTYQLQLIDNSSCASSTTGILYTAYTLGEGQFTTISQDAIGGANGSIQVLGVTPDPNSQLPPPVPLTGSFSLYLLPDYTPAGDPQTGTGALWENLPEGEYNVHFAPDSLCSHADTVITIFGATGIYGIVPDRSTPLHVWPQPAQNELQWTTTDQGALQVHDSRGSLLLSGKNTGHLDISDLPSGIYNLQISHGTTVERATFLKQ